MWKIDDFQLSCCVLQYTMIVVIMKSLTNVIDAVSV